MKKLLLYLSLFLFSVISVKSQNVTNITCYATSLSIYNEYLEQYGDWSSPMKYDANITYGQDYVKIVGDKYFYATVISIDKVSYYQYYSYFPMTCIDSNNKNCSIHTYYYYSSNKYEIVLQYWDFMVKYYCYVQ